jgi:16S rRNA (uracil1498-N3)-methyltransferase
MLQSRRYFLPEMYEPQSLESVIRWPIPIKTLAHCMDMGSKKQLSQLVQANKELMVCIGPEGDFTEAEVSACENAGFQSITLGQQRLRTETAGLFSLAQYHTALQMQAL